MRLLPVIPLVAVVLSTSCITDKQYRYLAGTNGLRIVGPDGTHESITKIKLPGVEVAQAGYKLGFVEFKDSGDYWDKRQLDRVIDLIQHEKSASPSGKIILVLYTHGWKNNADRAPLGSPPKDTERFKSALREIAARAKAEAGKNAPLPVVGVYIGWHGASLRGPSWFNFVSVWPRRGAANRVGGPVLAGAITKIIDQTRDGSPDSRILLTGHSFGARILERTLQTVSLYDPPTPGAPVTPKVDLVLYVNSANDARLTGKRVQEFRRSPVLVRHPDYDAAACTTDQNQARCRPYPLYVVITSRGDSATKYLLPFAGVVAPVFGVPGPQHEDGEFAGQKMPWLTLFSLQSAGHMGFLHSHDVLEMPCPADHHGPLQCEKSDAFCFRSEGECERCYRVVQRQFPEGGQPAYSAPTPFSIIAVDPPVIRDHGDIWNLSLIDMLGELMSPRGFFDPAMGRVRIETIKKGEPEPAQFGGTNR